MGFRPFLDKNQIGDDRVVEARPILPAASPKLECPYDNAGVSADAPRPEQRDGIHPVHSGASQYFPWHLQMIHGGNGNLL